jgi:hypothetical protein
MNSELIKGNALQALLNYSESVKDCQSLGEPELRRVVDELERIPTSSSSGNALPFADLHKEEFCRVRSLLDRLNSDDPVLSKQSRIGDVQSLVHELRLLADVYDSFPWVCRAYSYHSGLLIFTRQRFGSRHSTRGRDLQLKLLE